MSKKIKAALWSMVILLVVLLAALYISYFVLQVSVFDRSGWQIVGEKTYYLDYYGKPETHWLPMDGTSYYMGEDGSMRTGWQTIDEKRYYFDPDGKLHTGLLEENGRCWYLETDGTPYTGWLETDGMQTYFAEPDGLRHSGWLQLPEGTYYLDEEGHPQTGWIELEGIRYYLKPDGILDEAWQHDGKLLHYMPENQPCSGWYRGDAGVYWFDETGLQKTGWITDETGRFYLYADGTYATGFVEIDGVERYFLPSGEYIILCNRWNPIPDDYEMNLVSIGKKQVDASCAAQLQRMMDDGNAAGLTVKLNSTYRSKRTQQSMWETRRVKYMGQGMTLAEADAYIGQSVAVPGTSEHQTGLGVDIIGSKKMYAWLEENCWKYGFILRYPDDKIDVTGIIYEPWHFRYVGVEMAQDVMESGLCLEEYLEKLKSEQK